ncbi:MAG: glycosyltransferase, partial [Acidobacteria bacterium]|nr:glycosyltransferase [Acidobacteriota bacterium]
MKPPRSLKERFGDSLPLSFKLRLKRVFVGAVAAALRLGVGARGSGFAGRVVALAVTHGLDFERARDVYPPAPLVEHSGATDFRSLLSAVSGRKPSGPLADRDVRASIIIPVFNKAEFTFQCLRSLVREVDFGETEVIVVNNASTDETAQVLSHFGDFVRVIDNARNLGFVDACNRGAAAAKGRHLVFLNHDKVVLPGWLEGLLETVESDPQVGAVGAMLLYPEGRIQEAGAIVWKTGEVFHYGSGKS